MLTNTSISPGPQRLLALMDPKNSPIGSSISAAQREEELERFGTFPLYPTCVFFPL